MEARWSEEDARKMARELYFDKAKLADSINFNFIKCVVYDKGKCAGKLNAAQVNRVAQLYNAHAIPSRHPYYTDDITEITIVDLDAVFRPFLFSAEDNK